MPCYSLLHHQHEMLHKINSDVAQPNKFKLIKELSDIEQELNSNEPNVFLI